MNINEIVDQIERGLEGVTPGPWRRKPMKGYTDDYVLTDHPDFQQPKHGNLVAECGFSGGKVEHRYEADAAHIARCDPDTMRAIIAHIRELESRAEAAEAKVARLREALEPFAQIAEWDIGDIEHNEDKYQQMRERHAVGGVLKVKHFRVALAAMEATDE